MQAVEGLCADALGANEDGGRDGIGARVPYRTVLLACLLTQKAPSTPTSLLGARACCLLYTTTILRHLDLDLPPRRTEVNPSSQGVDRAPKRPTPSLRRAPQSGFRKP